MKYWLLTTEYPPQYGGGISTYVYYTARMFRDNGHEVTVFHYNNSLSSDKVTIEEGIRVVRFSPGKTGTGKFLGFNTRISYEYAHIVGEYVKREGAPDIIESQEFQGIAYYLQQFKWLGYEDYADLNIVITCHAPEFLCLEYNHVPVYQFPYYWIGQMEKSSIKSADLLISPSHYLVQQLKQRINLDGIGEQYIVNPIETTENKNMHAFRQNYIVSFGRLSPLKGTFELLQYFRKMWDSGFQHPLHLIGGGQHIFHPEGLMMEEVVKKKYKEYIERGLLVLEGELPPASAMEKLIDAAIVIMPSLIDNLPYTVLEAMSLGKVVLASKQGGQTEIITDGKDGFLFDHNIKDDFCNKLKHILGSGDDYLRSIRENAVKKIKSSYNPDTVYAQKMQCLTSFLRHKKKVRKKFPFIESRLPAPVTNSVQSDSNELLSIVVPYYNMGKYAEECIRSIRDSDYTSKEIIVVNDGSTDAHSIAVLELLEKQYGVKVYHKANEGLSLTRNYGASLASGRYLAFLDADDTVENTYYSKAIRVLAEYDNVQFVGCWTKYFGNSKDCWPAFNPEPPYLLVHNMVNSSALVYKKEAFVQYGTNARELVYGMEDWDSVINLVKHNQGGVVLPEILYNYRIRRDSMARAFTRVKQLHLYRVIGSRHSQFYNMYGNEVAQLLNANGSGIGFDNPTFEPATAGLLSQLPFSGTMKEKLKTNIKKNKYLRGIAYKVYKQLKN